MIPKSTKEEWINIIPQYFMDNIVMRDLYPYFNIRLSKDLINDMILLDNSYIPSSKNGYAGITILPFNDNEKIQILISENTCTIDIVLHELTHMYDMILFSEQFCCDRLSQVRNHKYYQTFIYWSEFHVKQIDIPHMHLLLDIANHVPKENLMCDFKNQIKTFFYPKYNEKLLNKKSPHIRDIMWYLGELYVCNIYDKDNKYSIEQEIIDIYGHNIIKLNDLVMKCHTFVDYAINAEEFHVFFQ